MTCNHRENKDTEDTNSSWPNTEIKRTRTRFLARGFLLFMTRFGANDLSGSQSIELVDATNSTRPVWLKPPGQGTTETKRQGSSEGNKGTSPSLWDLMSEAVFWPSSDFLLISCVAGINPSAAGLGFEMEACNQKHLAEGVRRAGTQL